MATGSPVSIWNWNVEGLLARGSNGAVTHLPPQSGFTYVITETTELQVGSFGPGKLVIAPGKPGDMPWVTGYSCNGQNVYAPANRALGVPMRAGLSLYSAYATAEIGSFVTLVAAKCT